MNTKTEKIVSRFRRTLSFPNPIITKATHKSYHIRSVSLPCRSHPLISQINHDIHHLHTWLLHHHQNTRVCSAHVVDGIIKLRNLHDSFHHLIHLPTTQESLCRNSNSVQNLLDQFLVYIDVYGRFRAALVSLEQDQCSAQVGIRRGDESSVALYLKTRKIVDTEIKKLISIIGSMQKRPVTYESFDIELAGVVADVNRMTVSVTTAMLNAVSTSSYKYKTCIRALPLKKKSDQSTKIQEFEQVEAEMLKNLRKRGNQEATILLRNLVQLDNCVVRIENESGKLFRSLMNTRVSLLNVIT